MLLLHPYRFIAFFALLLMTAVASGQSADCLRTRRTRLCFEAGPRNAHLSSISGRSSKWLNRNSEPFISSAELDGRVIPLKWTAKRELFVRSKSEVRYVYESSEPKLRMYWEWETRSDIGPVEHRIRIENLGNFEVWLPLQSSLGFSLALSTSANLEHWYVEKGADTPSSEGTHRVEMRPGYTWSGYSTTYAHPVPGKAREIIPWMLVRDSSQRSGFYVGVEFSGRLRLDLSRAKNGITGKVGLDPDPAPFRTRLRSGEIFETPVVFLSAFEGNVDDAGNDLRRWVREVLGSRDIWKDERYPYLTSNSWGSGMEVDESVAKRMIHDSAQLGLEMFHLDAGWFKAVGDWSPDPKKFPNGLKAVADEAHSVGLKFGLWIDWAQAGVSKGEGALNVTDPKVRHWLVTDLPANWTPEAFKGQTIDIGVPAAKQWVEAKLDGITQANDLDMLEHDGYLVAQGCVRQDHPHAPPDAKNIQIQKDAGFLFAYSSNSTDVSYHATRSYYAIQDRMRRTRPGMLLEVCNDGGRMVDFGSAAHGDYFSITDTYDPVSNRRVFYDTSWVLPPAMLESYVEKWNARNSGEFLYMLRSGMMGWFSVMQDTAAWTPEQHDIARKEIQLYKSRLRPLIRAAHLYHVGERPDGVHWDGMQYMDRERMTGVLFAFRGSGGGESHVFRPRGLNPARKYSLHFRDHPALDRVVSGRALLRDGLLVRLASPNTSELVFVEAVH